MSRSEALGYAIANLVPEHLTEVKTRRIAEIDKVEREVRARLTREINYWDARAARLREEERAGKEQRINAQNAEATAHASSSGCTSGRPNSTASARSRRCRRSSKAPPS